MSDILSAFFLTFVGLFPIVNPLESAPFFYSMTAGLSSPEREAMARRVAINGFGLLLGSMVLGPYVLEFFGIQLAVVRIAGGLVVTALGWKLLTQDEHAIHAETAELESKRRRKIGSFYPLTMPLTVGPGSMSVAITIGSGSGSLSAAILDGSPLKGPVPLAEIAAHATGAFLGLVLIGLAIYLAYRFAATVARKLGETGLDVLVRLSAFILICIGIEILWSGLRMLTTGTNFAPG
jgi:multiple antibiotic resistance protein